MQIDWSSFDNREVLDDELGRFIYSVRGGYGSEVPQPDDSEAGASGFCWRAHGIFQNA